MFSNLFLIFFFNYKICSSPIYETSDDILTISGDGSISQSGVMSTGDYKKTKEVIILDGPTIIQYQTFYEFISLKKITISKTVESISSPFFRCYNLKEIIVSEDNPKYCSLGGVLYSKNYEYLIGITAQQITIHEKVKTICHKSFALGVSFSGLENLLIPDSVIEFEDWAFNEAKIQSLTFGSNPSLESIRGFQYSTINTIMIPKSCKSIETNCFLGTAITQIIFQETSTLEVLQEKSFSQVKIESISFPNSLKEIKDSAFYQATKIKSLSFGENLEIINVSAFSGCTNLINLSIHPNNQYYSSDNGIIMNKAKTEIIYLPPTMETLVISSNIENIGSTLIQSSQTLINIEVDENNKNYKARDGVLYNQDFTRLISVCGGRETVVASEKVIELGDLCCFGLTLLKSFTFSGTKCESIGTSAFSQSSIINLSIPDSVTEIKDSVFSKCLSLVTIYFTKTSQLQTIGERCFEESSIKTIHFPSLLNSLSDYCFRLSKIEEIVFSPNSVVTSLPQYFCESCTELVRIELPASLEETGFKLFISCSKLKEVIFPSNSSLETISQSTFESCISLESIVLPNSVHTICNSAFAGCEKLIHVENQAQYIETRAFSSCSSLTSFNFSSTISSLNGGIFRGCNNITNFTVDSSNPIFKDFDGIIYDISGTILYLYPPGREFALIERTTERFAQNAFSYSEKLRFVAFQTGTTMSELNSTTFLECVSLTTVQFPPAIIKIRSSCFKGCISLKSIYLPVSLVTIESEAFLGCSSLRDIKYCGNAEILTEGVFDVDSLSVYVTSFYPSDHFCGYLVNKLLSYDCQFPPKVITCSNSWTLNCGLLSCLIFLSK